MRITHRKSLAVAKLIAGRWTSRQIVTSWRLAEREEVIALACRIRFTVTRKEIVFLGDAMIDADVVAVDDRVLLAVRLEVATDTRKSRQRESIQVVLRKG